MKGKVAVNGNICLSWMSFQHKHLSNLPESRGIAASRDVKSTLTQTAATAPFRLKKREMGGKVGVVYEVRSRARRTWWCGVFS